MHKVMPLWQHVEHGRFDEQGSKEERQGGGGEDASGGGFGGGGGGVELVKRRFWRTATPSMRCRIMNLFFSSFFRSFLGVVAKSKCEGEMAVAERNRRLTILLF